MYQPHRPQQPPPTRLGELLEQVKAEFDAQASRTNDYDLQRKSRLPWSEVRAESRAREATHIQLSFTAYSHSDRCVAQLSSPMLNTWNDCRSGRILNAMLTSPTPQYPARFTSWSS